MLEDELKTILNLINYSRKNCNKENMDEIEKTL
jgi:hypothetical protein